MYKPGQNVPDLAFRAYYNDEFVDMDLARYAGKWLVLLFYPADFSFVCPTELEEAAKYYQAFQKENAEVISISTDTVYAHKTWHDTSETIRDIAYPMVADPTHRICEAFDFYNEQEGTAYRGTIIVDPDSTVRVVEMHDNSVGRSIKELLRKLQAAKFVRQHKGQVCPVQWEPGEGALGTGLENVGKI